jgi:hypothetical protein
MQKPTLKDDCRIAKEKQNHGMSIVAGKKIKARFYMEPI